MTYQDDTLIGSSASAFMSTSVSALSASRVPRRRSNFSNFNDVGDRRHHQTIQQRRRDLFVAQCGLSLGTSDRLLLRNSEPRERCQTTTQSSAPVPIPFQVGTPSCISN